MSGPSGLDAAPGGPVQLRSDPSVLWRAVVAWVALVLTIASVTGAALALSGNLGQPRTFLVLTMVGLGIAAVLGGCRAAYWRCRLESTEYQMDAAGITMRAGSTTTQWAWTDIDMVRVEGSMGWTDLLMPASVEDFPALCVRSAGQTTRGPGLLMWGRSTTDVLNAEVTKRLTHARADT
jgi:hypothetical protein